jgi:hypothetical protein
VSTAEQNKPFANLEAAQELARQGFAVFPCKIDKSPLTTHGFQDATTNGMQLTRWWRQWPYASVGIATGQKSRGLVVLDVDPRNGGWSTLGDLGEIPETLEVRTGGGGAHYYFRHPTWVKCRNNRAEGVDVKADGGYVIAPPSMHASGTAYSWANSLPIAACPQWILDYANGIAVRHGSNSKATGTAPVLAAVDGELVTDLPDWVHTYKSTGEGLSDNPRDSFPPTTLERVASALDAIDPDIDRDSWLKIGRAIYREFGDAGYSVFKSWSDRSERQDQKKFAKEWDSFANTHSVDIATVFWFAREAGWKDETSRSEQVIDELVKFALGKFQEPAPAPEPRDNITESRTTEPTAAQAKLETEATDRYAEQIEEGDKLTYTNGGKSTLESMCLADIEPQRIEWLWQHRFALGKLSLIAGYGGLNKSTLTLDMACRVTTGAEWPHNEGNAPLGNVVLLSAEDDPADTIVPRIMAMGGDRKRIHLVKAAYVVTDDGPKRTWVSLQRDVELLQIMMMKLGNVKLVIIDPINAYMGGAGTLDTHRDSDVRGVLAPLHDMATSLHCAVVLVTHLTKSSSEQRAISKVIGSQAYTAAARSVWMVTLPPETEESGPPDEDLRWFLHGKNNLARKAPGLSYRVVERKVGSDNDIEACAIEFTKEVLEVDTDEVLAAVAIRINLAEDAGGPKAPRGR